MNRYVATSTLPVDATQAFAYHERPGALSRLIPPWQKVVVESSDGSLAVGSKVVIRLSIGPLSLRWHAEHTAYDPPQSFEDIQTSGPFASWHHRHSFEGGSETSCVLRDEVSYQLPLGSMGSLLGGGKVRRDLESMFAYRHRVTRDDLKAAVSYGVPPLSIGISGCSGLLGSRLSAFLTLLGHEVVRLERSLASARKFPNAIAPWDSDEESEKLNELDAVVHLAGKSIASARWTPTVKEQIRSSRVVLTTKLAESLSTLSAPPQIFICASATGLYGRRGDEVLNEDSSIGDDFLAEVVKEWEASCEPARTAGIRVVNARFGIILDPSGGALAKMLTPAKLFGGKLGNGRQWWSWISIDDAVGAIYHAIATKSLTGPMNVVAPKPIQNAEFARRLGAVLGRPALFPAPSFALRATLGEMADALLLASSRVEPSVLQSTGYEYRFESLDAALRYCLGKDRLESIEGT